MLVVRTISIIIKIAIAIWLFFIILSNKSSFISEQNAINSMNYNNIQLQSKQSFNDILAEMNKESQCINDDKTNEPKFDAKVVNSLLDQLEDLTGKMETQTKQIEDHAKQIEDQAKQYDEQYMILYDEYTRINKLQVKSRSKKSLVIEDVDRNYTQIITHEPNITNSSYDDNYDDKKCVYKWSLLHYVFRAFGSSRC